MKKERAGPVPHAIEKVWGYPATEDNAGHVHWAWSCRCGKHGDSYPDQPAARAAAVAHFDARAPRD
jgi:hypothetical protein